MCRTFIKRIFIDDLSHEMLRTGSKMLIEMDIAQSLPLGPEQERVSGNM